jgi:hypothetical protein
MDGFLMFNINTVFACPCVFVCGDRGPTITLVFILKSLVIEIYPHKECVNTYSSKFDRSLVSRN